MKYKYAVSSLFIIFIIQGEFAQIIYQGGPELVKNCIRPDGNVVMVNMYVCIYAM